VVVEKEGRLGPSRILGDVHENMNLITLNAS